MTLEEYQSLVLSLYPKWSEAEHKVNGGFGILGEAGEVTEHIKKELFQNKPVNVDALTHELGDVLNYVSYIASAYGIALDDVMQANVEKITTRYRN